MAEKKESYSEEELNEMIVWFNNHADELPKEMQINKSAFTPDLKLAEIISPPITFASPIEAFVFPTAVGPVSTTSGFFFILYDPLEFLF